MTPRRQVIHDFIRGRIDATGLAPTYGEIGDQLGTVSRAGVKYHIDALVAAGKLVRTPCRKRNLALPGVDLSVVTSSELRAELDRRERRGA